MEKQCATCNKTFAKKSYDSKKYWLVKKFCSIKCSGTLFKKGVPLPEEHKENLRSIRGSKHPSYKGSVTMMNGYNRITHPQKGGLIPEHRYIMEVHLKRELTDQEHVHHINGVRDDNRIENLVVMDKIEHNRMHTTNNWKNGIY